MIDILLFLITLMPMGQLDSSSFYVESMEAQTAYDSRYIFERASRIVPREKLVRMSDIDCLVNDLKVSGLFEDVKAELVPTGPNTRKLILTCTYRAVFDRLVIKGLEIEDVPFIDRGTFRKELDKSGVKVGTRLSKLYYRTLEERINKAFRAALPQNLANNFSGWTCITLRTAGREEIRIIVSPDYSGCAK